MMVDTLFFLLLGHFLGDFAFQSDQVAEGKRTSRLVLTRHVFIYTLTIAAALALGLHLNGSEAFFSVLTIAVLAILFVQHWTQDFLKSHRFNGTRQAFYVDQGLHLLVLFLIRVVYPS
ncbi:MAG: DUF3307 domain-containing protein [Candidatus Zixiibacteriota bacterium]